MEKRITFIRSEVLHAGIFIIGVGVLAHVLYSWIGYNPTDDGFTLAYSRRLLSGEIPHRDFISLRPVLSPLIHVPFVLFGGAYTFLVSRLFVWMELAAIAWLWTVIARQGLHGSLSTLRQYFLAVIAFAISAHNFPIMAWSTIDGLLLATIGLVIVTHAAHSSKRTSVGFILIGASYLCKQSFLFFAPLAVLLAGDWRNKRHWVAVASPGVVYGLFVVFTGSLGDALQQFTAQANFVTVGIDNYINNPNVLQWAVAGLVGAWLLAPARDGAATNIAVRVFRAVLGMLILAGVPLYYGKESLSTALVPPDSFSYWGIGCGVVLYLIIVRSQETRDARRTVALAVLLAWSASLSLGYNSPVLGIGAVFVVLVAYVLHMLQRHAERELQFAATVILGIFVIATGLAFNETRTLHIYRDRSAAELTMDVGEVLPGASGIKTNQNTYAFLADLREVTQQISSQGKLYALLPGGAGWWVKAAQKNPLPIDWVMSTEVPSKELEERVFTTIDSLRGSTVFILHKIFVENMAFEKVPLGDRGSFITEEYIRQNFRPAGETEFFLLYE